MSRQTERATERAAQKARTKALVYIPVADEFLDMDDEPWHTRVNGDLVALNLTEILIHTLQFAPVRTGEETFRVLDVREALKACTDADYISISEDDFIWLLKHLRDNCFQVWQAANVAFLIRFLEVARRNTPPRADAESSNGRMPAGALGAALPSGQC